MKFTILCLFMVSLVSSVFAQITKPPSLTSDASQAAIQRARAKAITVPPTAGRRADMPVQRGVSGKDNDCSMTIAPLPDKHGGANKLGTVNQIVVIETAPILVCGR